MTQVPRTNPSVLNSSAGEAMELAKPVMGTSVPAPAKRASFSKSRRAVSSTPRRMSVQDTAVPAETSSSPAPRKAVLSPWPRAQMLPPTKKAAGTVLYEGLAGESGP